MMWGEEVRKRRVKERQYLWEAMSELQREAFLERFGSKPEFSTVEIMREFLDSEPCGIRKTFRYDTNTCEWTADWTVAAPMYPLIDGTRYNTWQDASDAVDGFLLRPPALFDSFNVDNPEQEDHPDG